jgi:hypothetical protein
VHPLVGLLLQRHASVPIAIVNVTVMFQISALVYCSVRYGTCCSDDDDCIGRDRSEELTRPVLHVSEADTEGQKLQQHKGEVAEVGQEEQDSNSSNNSEIDNGK